MAKSHDEAYVIPVNREVFMTGRDYFLRVQAQTPTRYWINNPSREQADVAIECGAAGCTLNPSYTEKMLSNDKERPLILKRIDELIDSESDDTIVLEKLQSELVCGIAEKFLPIYESSGAEQGFVSIQGDPYNEKANNIISYGKKNAAKYPNITPKVPVVPEGLTAIGELIASGISVNSTEIFAIDQFISVAELYVKITKGMKNKPTLFYSHIAGIFDEYLIKYIKENAVSISPDTVWQAGCTVAKKMEAMRIERRYPVRMISGGARGLQHFTEIVGAQAQVTINWAGASDALLDENPAVVQRFLRPTPQSVIDELVEKLPDFKKAWLINGLSADEYEHFGPVQLFWSSFAASWKAVLDIITQRRLASASPIRAFSAPGGA